MNWLKRMWYKNDVFRYDLWLTTLIVTAVALAVAIASDIMLMDNILTKISNIVTCLGGFITLTGLAATLVN